MSTEHLLDEAAVRFLKSLAGYPWLPCPICKGIEGCSDTVSERARAYGHNIQREVETRQ